MLRLAAALIAVQALAGAAPVRAQDAQVDEHVSGLSALDSLLSLPVAAAAKYNQRRSDAAASVSVITSAEIATYGHRTLADVFQALPGFYVSDDLNYSYAGVRGFSRPSDYNNRLLVLLDGRTMNEAFYSSAPVGTELGLDLRALDRIEIIRGPGSALYGASAMFGVVNLITKTGNQINGIDLTADAGSGGTREGSVLFGKRLASGLDVTASANWSDVQGNDRYFPEFDAPETNFGVAQGLDWGKWYAGRATLRYGALRFDVGGASRRRGVPTAAWETEFNNPDFDTMDRRFFGQVSFDHELGRNVDLTVRGFGQRFTDQGIYPYESNWVEGSTSTTVGSEARLQWDASASHRIITGLEGQIHPIAKFYSRDADGEYWGGDFPFEQVSLYVQDEFQLGQKVSATLGGRYDAYSVGENALSPRAAILVHPSDQTTFKLLYGSAFRSPSVWEREYHEPDAGGHMKNSALGPETVRTLEASVEQRLGGSVVARASVFRYRISGLIDFATAPAPDSLLQFGTEFFIYDNVNAATARGAEVEANAAWDFGGTAYANYTYQRVRDETLDVSLSNSPAHMAKLGLAVPVRYATLGANAVYESRRMTVQDTYTSSHFLVDLTISRHDIRDHLSVTGSVRNALNAEYAHPGGWEHTQAAIPQYGRRFYIQLGYRH